MCTATWLREDERLTLFFNRDELRVRRPAEPPAPRRKGAVSFLAPLDGNHGGTWIAASDRGLVLCLLNGAAAAPDSRPASEFTSRGLLVTALIDSASAEQAGRRLRRMGATRFRPYVLAAFDREGPAWVSRWDGIDLDISPGAELPMPLVSSSFRGTEVCQSRIDVFRGLRPEAGEAPVALHRRYHASHLPERGPHSTCMHRPEARTVSYSEVRIEPERVRFAYADGPPCRTPLRLDVATLPLSA